MVSHCGFNLHFTNGEWRWVSFHVSVGHLYVFFERCLFIVMSSANFLIRFLCVCVGGDAELYKFFAYLRYQPLVKYTICKYLLLFSRLPSHFDGFLCCAEVFQFTVRAHILSTAPKIRNKLIFRLGNFSSKSLTGMQNTWFMEISRRKGFINVL